MPTGPDRSAGVTKVRTDQGAQGLLVELLASTEFFAMAGSTDSGFVYTAGQRVLKRDLSAAEAAPFIAGLGDSSKSRADIATGLVGGVEGSRVRAKMWVEKLLSRVPTDPELELWGSQAETAGDLAVVGAIAGGLALIAAVGLISWLQPVLIALLIVQAGLALPLRFRQ